MKDKNKASFLGISNGLQDELRIIKAKIEEQRKIKVIEIVQAILKTSAFPRKD